MLKPVSLFYPCFYCVVLCFALAAPCSPASASCPITVCELVSADGDYLLRHDIVLKMGDSVQAQPIKLDYWQRNFSVTIRQEQHTDSCQGFDYKLHGYSSHWDYSKSGKLVASFAGLKPGSYKLLVKHRNASHTSYMAVPIEIPGPLWNSWWFITIAAAAFAALAAFAGSQFAHRKSRLKKVLEKQVVSRTKILEDKAEEIERQKQHISEQNNNARIQAEQIAEQKEELEKQRTELQKLVRSQSNDLAAAKKQMAEQTKEAQISHSKFQLLAENSRDMIFRMKLPEDLMEYVSPASKLLTGYAPEDFCCTPGLFRKIIAKESRDKYIEARRRILSGESLPSIDYKIITKDGQEKWVSQRNVTIKGRNGEIEAIEAIVFDVTDQKKDVSAIKAAKIRAEESDKLKTAFFASMSSEVRIPMNALIGFADLLKEPGLSADDRSFFVDQINQNCASLLKMIDDMVDVAKIDAGELDISLREENIEDLCMAVYDSFLARKAELPVLDTINFTVEIDEAVRGISVETDGTRITQILNNLIDNALKFTEAGYVKFGVSRNLANKLELMFFVEDTGRGIPAEKHVEIFDQYRNVRSNIQKKISGPGIGLSISRSLVEILGGKMELKSHSGKGSVFTFTIPIDKKTEKAPDPAPEEAAAAVADWTDKHILVAEDEDNNFKFMQAALKKTGVQLIRARDGQEALEIFKEKHHLIDLVLMDIQMPKMNGYEATKALLEVEPSIPVIAQTAFAMSGGKIKCFDAGCIGYISKPYKARDLIDAIEKHIK
jgi:PAS domain S-box-containing protein